MAFKGQWRYWQDDEAARRELKANRGEDLREDQREEGKINSPSSRIANLR